MPFNSVISRSDAAALIPEEVSDAILNDVAASNPLLSMARRLPNMNRAQQRMPVMSALATAYFVNGDTGLKQTSEVNWANKYIDAEELAVIVPIPKNVLDDADYDIWGQTRPQLVQALNKAIASAVLFGTNIPASWTTNLGAAGLLALCTAKSHTISLAAYSDLYEATLGETAAGADGLYMLVEDDGFGVTGNLAHVSMKGKLRNTRDSDGNPIFKTTMQDVESVHVACNVCAWTYTGVVPAGSQLVIDCGARSVRNAGIGDYNGLTFDSTHRTSEWMILEPGVNMIVYTIQTKNQGSTPPPTINFDFYDAWE